MSDGSGSHCKMMSESPTQFNTFTPNVTVNVSVALYVPTTVHVPYTNDFTYMLDNCSSSEAATSFKKSNHTEQLEVSCLRWCARYVCWVQIVLCL